MSPGEFCLGGDWTTCLTIYGFGLRGNSANESTRKHRFRTKRHRKALKIKQKIDMDLFGTLRSWVRSPSPRPRKGDNFDTKSIEIIALFVAFRVILPYFRLLTVVLTVESRFLVAPTFFTHPQIVKIMR